MSPLSHRLAATVLAMLAPVAVRAQLQPLGPPPIPPGNPQSAAKVALGKALFWEEQLSLTGTVACGTCHRPNAGGADPRTGFGGLASTHPGPDGVFGNADDVIASAGVPAHGGNGQYQPSASFGLRPQVGGRRSQAAINSGYSPLLFWDGRAGPAFTDPLTGTVLLQAGGALENQALGPLVDSSEMAPAGADLAMVPARIELARPLALASNVPAALDGWIAGRGYPALFTEVFGSAAITPARIAFAIAAYERTLNSTQTPLDAELAGTPSLTQQELQGRNIFNTTDCNGCHAGSLFSDNQFHYIGVRPNTEDPGRFARTGNPQDQGAFRTPSLRNVAERAPYMHNGRFATLEQVVDFYARGGDFNAPNKDPRVRPRNLNPQQRAALVAFLRRPLSDPRVAAEQAPFDRPTLYSESTRVPVIEGSGRAGSGGVVPQLGALEPPLLGSSNFTVNLSQALPGASAKLVVDRADPGLVDSMPVGAVANLETTVGANGIASVNLTIADGPVLPGDLLYGRYYVLDPQAPNGLAVTPAFRVTVFGVSETFLRNGFE